MNQNAKNIRYWQAQADHAEADAHALRKEVAALKAGVVTKYEVVTLSRTGTRNTRGFGEIIDALHHAATLRIEADFDQVTINEIETRRQALYPDGRVIHPFGN